MSLNRRSQLFEDTTYEFVRPQRPFSHPFRYGMGRFSHHVSHVCCGSRDPSEQHTEPVGKGARGVRRLRSRLHSRLDYECIIYRNNGAA